MKIKNTLLALLIALSSSLALNGMQQQWENPYTSWEAYDKDCSYFEDVNEDVENQALFKAVLKNDVVLARQALEAGADIDATIARNLRKATLDAVLDMRAAEPGFIYPCINVRNEEIKSHGVEAGNTALHLAITFAHLHMLPRERYATEEEFFAANKSPMIKLLLISGANLDIPNNKGIWPELLAAVCSSSEKHSKDVREIYGKIYESLTKIKNLEKQSAEGSDEYLNS